jgi:hypothetical protein
MLRCYPSKEPMIRRIVRTRHLCSAETIRCSDEAQVCENRISGGALGLIADPLLHQRQPVGRLVNIIAIRDIPKGLQDLTKTIDPGGNARNTAVKAVRDGSRQIRYPSTRHMSPSGAADLPRMAARFCRRRSRQTSDASAPYRDTCQYRVIIELWEYTITYNFRKMQKGGVSSTPRAFAATPARWVQSDCRWSEADLCRQNRTGFRRRRFNLTGNANLRPFCRGAEDASQK